MNFSLPNPPSTLFTEDPLPPSCARTDGSPDSAAFHIDQLPGYFINREGDVEPSSLPGFSNADRILSLGRFSKKDAFNHLRRALIETGQFVIRTSDDSLTAWFAGIGDPENLFVELRPRDIWMDRDELVMGTVCSLADAERLLALIYCGSRSETLSSLFHA